MSRRNSDLPIWNFFEKPIDGSKIASCNYCHRELSFKTSITNLKQHLKQKHISVYNNLINFGKTLESTASETVWLDIQKAGIPAESLNKAEQRAITIVALDSDCPDIMSEDDMLQSEEESVADSNVLQTESATPVSPSPSRAPTARRGRFRNRHLNPRQVMQKQHYTSRQDFFSVAKTNAESMKVLAASTKLQAKAAVQQAEAAKKQAEASLLFAQAADKIANALSSLADAWK